MSRLFLFCAVLFSSAACASDTPEAFFERFAMELRTFNPVFADRYADDAKVSVFGRKGGSVYLIREYSGSDWKEWVLEMMPLVKENGDATTFSNVQVNAADDVVTVTADRRSEGQCYTDTEYQLVLRPDEDSFQVIEERIEVHQESHC